MFDNLGIVNLIVGSNGTGKTSLLEAIEYLYCLENARTASPHHVRIQAKLMGATTWQETQTSGKTAEAKQRNLDWYGQRDLRGSTLANSFSRFNFLSTDEAAMLGRKDAKASFEDMLSQLVSGPQAAALWDHISRLTSPLENEYSRIQNTLKDATQQKASLEALISTLAENPRASDSDLSTLVEDLSRLGWKAGVSRGNVVSETVPALNRASSLAHELMIMRLGIDRVSYETITQELIAVDANLPEIDKRLKRLSVLDADATRMSVAKRELQKAIQEINATKRALQLNAFELISELEELQQRIIDIRSAVDGLELPRETPVWLQELKVPLSEAVASIKQQREALAEQEAVLESRLMSVRETQSATTSMVVEIQALAKQLLAASPNHTDCPICSTVFKVGELQRRLEKSTLSTSTDSIDPITHQLSASRNQLSVAESKLTILNDLEIYANRRGLFQINVLPEEVISDFHTEQERLVGLQRENSEIDRRVSGLAKSGLTDEVIHAMRQAARRMGIDIQSLDRLDRELSRKTDEIAEIEGTLDSYATERKRLTSEICMTISGVEETKEPIDDIVIAFRNRRAQLQTGLRSINELRLLITLGGDSNIPTIAPLIDSAKASAERFSQALVHESATRAKEAAAKLQLEEIERRIRDGHNAIERLQRVMSVLAELEKEDSLIAATDTELEHVQTETAEIFRRIHSPHEYDVRRDIQAPLYKLNEPNQHKTLREVSTGQRTAYVISVFLAMNAKLQTAPPVVLLDDPVAHVDDFNSLSFLDHLRNIALTGKRQIFYATADSRLAGLFAHKFSFMGDRFRRFDLMR